MVGILEKDFKIIINEIKKDIRSTQTRTLLQANSKQNLNQNIWI